MNSLSPHDFAPQELPHYVYTLAYPESMGGCVFYVGKGMRNRINAHEYEARNSKRSNHKLNTIRKIWQAGGQVVKKKLACFATDEESIWYEIALIFFMDGLTNLTEGGDGLAGLDFSPEHRRRLREAIQKREGTTLSQEIRSKISEARKKRPYDELYTEEWRRKNSESHKKPKWYESPLKGKALSEEHRRKLSEATKRSNANNEELRQARISHLQRGNTKGRKLSEAHRQKIAEANKRRGSPSEESRRKNSETNKRIAAQKREKNISFALYYFANTEGTIMPIYPTMVSQLNLWSIE